MVPCSTTRVFVLVRYSIVVSWYGRLSAENGAGSVPNFCHISALIGGI